MTAPRIDHQPLEAGLGLLGERHRRLEPALGPPLPTWASTCSTSVATCQSASRDIVCPSARVIR